MNSHEQAVRSIKALMYTYAECVDLARFDELGELFSHGVLTSTSSADPGDGMSGDDVAAFYAATNKVHGDGTLRTRHVASNVIVDVAEDGQTAAARSYFAVHQGTDSLPLQPIVTGRYEDDFALMNGQWRFARRLVLVDQIGDMREHLTFDLSKGNVRYTDHVESG
ncbi:nuclear transport factor 2 family protein [Candidatus Poriferisocius sp.]|uniref:nuclear transport factor 2 family protein n=1 Tax=Candidatus Poriferisocius sp. TaxID=3101276 RepID=UPI003B0265D6